MAKKRGTETRASSAETGTLAGEGADSSSGVAGARGAASQLMELFLHVCAALGAEDARDIAAIADVSPENVANWRSGAVREFKPQKLEAAKRGLELRIRALRARARESHGRVGGLAPLEIESGSGPAELQRQFRDSVPYDYLGHRFLYFDAQGALAWERVLSTGYDQDVWLQGVSSAATAWLDPSTRPPGPLAGALGLDRRTRPRGLDVVSLGPGEGTKETLILQAVRAACEGSSITLPWLAYAPVDVSIPLLLRASAAPRARDEGRPPLDVLAFCADFEEGPLEFATRLPTTTESDGLRLVLMLGNVFGNLRSEEQFVRRKLFTLVRPGDLVWLEVGLRPERIADDPLFRATEPDREETSAETMRRLLLEGPYRRWEAASGRPPSTIEMRITLREDDDSARVPGSCNFCHDVVIREERRAVTMLYSRRYALEGLRAWCERLGLRVERMTRVSDGRGIPRVAHLLLRRTA